MTTAVSTGTAPSDRTSRRAVVVGAGIVGIATTLYLQRDGWSVTMLDPEPAGETTSGGNAGLFAVGHVTPVAMPGLLPRVPRMLLDPDGSLVIRWRYLPRLVPWLVHFVRASLPGRVEAISRALADLLKGAWLAYEPLLEEAGANGLVRRQGFLVVHRTAATLAASSSTELEIKRRLGIRIETVERAAMLRLAPSLAERYAIGVFYPDCGHTVDPKRLVVQLAQRALGGGAVLRRERAVGFETGTNGVSAVLTDAGRHGADIVVVAAGAWSKPLAAMLGSRVPLDTERGYHVTLADPGVELACPVVPGDLRFCMTPMAMGLRLAGTVEFAGLDAPENPSRRDIMLRHARLLFPGLRTDRASTWMGRRPSMPDSLPVIGRAPRHRNAYFAFGHGHIGLTAAAVTGRAVAALAADRTPPVDLAPFRAERFS